MEHRISVAIATYNGEKFIEEQLDSIRCQTRPVQEVVITDDRSKDRTVEVVEAYIHKYGLEDSWSISVNEKNKGYAGNFMTALKKCSGDVLFFCDQDDIWVEDRVERMVQVMDAHPDCMLLGSEFEPFYDSPDALRPPEWELKMQKNDGSVEKMKYEPRNIPIGCQGCTMCMTADFLKKIQSYWYEGWAHDEYVWKLALVLNGLYMYHSFTIKRRFHAGNASLNKMHQIGPRVKFLNELLKSHEATLRFAKDVKAGDDVVKLLEHNVKGTGMRIDVLKNKKIFNTFPLVLSYLDCYHKKRAVLVELKMALTQKYAE